VIDEAAREPSVAEPHDGALLAAGDSWSFGVFYDRHSRALLAFCFRRTGDADIAADVAMETFAEAFVHRHRYVPVRASARPWLFGIARNQIRRLAHGRTMSTKYRERLGLATTASLDEIDAARIEALVDFEPMRDSIRTAMATLPKHEADALWLRVGLELPYTIVAERLGCSVGAARVRVLRGLERLSDRMELA
jgi:RNA polymerase sigma-70 factor (ECF subfamily)